MEREKVGGVTIDGEGSLALDDAIDIQNSTLIITITDAGSAILPNSSIANNARKLAFTRYNMSRVRHMLPEEYSFNKLSLLPDCERNAISVFVAIEDNLQISKVIIKPTIFVSNGRLTYKNADSILEDKNHILFDKLNALEEVAKVLINRRHLLGGIAIFDRKQRVVTTEEGLLRPLAKSETYRSNLIVRECMMYANECVTNYCATRQLPIIYRNQRQHISAPQSDSVSIDLINTISRSDNFDLLTVRSRLILILLKAFYGSAIYGHYALNLPAYAHTTSPLRRYVDLYNQWVLLAHLMGHANYDFDMHNYIECESVSAHANAIEQIIKDARGQWYPEEATQNHNLAISRAKCAYYSPAKFSKLIESVADGAQTLDSHLRDEISLRLNNNKLLEVDFFYLLFGPKSNGRLWNKLKIKIYEWLKKHPQMAYGAYQFGINKEALPVINWTVKKRQRNRAKNKSYKISKYRRVASVVYNDIQYISRPSFATDEKTAKHLAVLGLIGQLIGLDKIV